MEGDGELFVLSQAEASREAETPLFASLSSDQCTKELDQCNKAFKVLLRSQFVSSSLQTELTTISEWASAMDAGRNPDSPKSMSEDSFHKRCRVTLDLLCSCCKRWRP